MPKDIEKEYLLKAIGAFKRRFIVVSPEFKILAANCPSDEIIEAEIIGKRCYELFYDNYS